MATFFTPSARTCAAICGPPAIFPVLFLKALRRSRNTDLPTLGRDALAGVISAVVQIAYCVSFAALIFTGDLAGGFSLGLERILVVMQEKGMFPPSIENAGVDLLVVAPATANIIGRIASGRSDVMAEGTKLVRSVKDASGRAADNFANGVRIAQTLPEFRRAGLKPSV
mgnify:CR=1 FL=1